LTRSDPSGWDSSRDAAIADAINKQTSLSSNLPSRWRWLSGVIAGAYLVSAAFAGGFVDVLRVVAFLLVPMAAIWFPDEVGSHVGGRITRPSPGWAVRALGWLVLFMPIVAVVIIWSRS
jgi:hypothetical protein